MKELRRKPRDWLKSTLVPEYRQWLPIKDEQLHSDGERMVAEVFRCSTFINSEAVTSKGNVENSRENNRGTGPRETERDGVKSMSRVKF